MTDIRGEGRCESAGFVPPASLYIHIPICASKCTYCDFFSVPESSLPAGIEAGLVEAILMRARDLSRRFGAEAYETVYVGGGTPTLLSPEALDLLLSGIRELARGAGERGPRQWTVEANPDSLGEAAIEAMLRRGVTRLSVGVQCLDSGALAFLGRRHGPDAALRAIRLAAQSGLAVSADLLARIPARGDSAWRAAGAGALAREALELIDAGVTHLSVYDLTIEEGTPLAKEVASLLFPSEDEELEARRLLESALRGAGMRRYEVSNYAAVGDECLHNCAYWHMDSYIGVGPGAVSTLARESGASLRIEESRTIGGYSSLAEPASEIEIGLRDAAFESVMMAFRTSFGLDLAAFRDRFGMEVETIIGESLFRWRDRLVAGEPWPGRTASCGLALDGEGLDILNRFLGDCLDEIDRRMPT